MKKSSMELESPVAAKAKRMWNYLRAVFFMIRKGLLSKTKLVVSMQLMMKRSNKVVVRSVANLLSHHHHHHSTSTPHRDYEFSCSNSPNPAFFHGSISKRRLVYFPCLGAVVEEPHGTPLQPAVPLQRIEYSPSPGLSQELAEGAQLTPAHSPFSVRISDYSSEEEKEGMLCGNEEVDNEAEEFIRRFYEQLRTQNQIALLQYHEMECQEMLARGM